MSIFSSQLLIILQLNIDSNMLSIDALAKVVEVDKEAGNNF